jgi:hypothetical protein
VVFVSMWDTYLRGTSATAQLVYLRLRTGPESSPIPGVVLIGPAGLAEALGWTLAKAKAALDELAAKGLLVADRQARLVFIPRAAVEGAPDNPNHVTSWARYWTLVPECDLKSHIRSNLRVMLEERGPTFVAAFDRACPDGSTNLAGNVPPNPPRDVAPNVTPKVGETGSGGGVGPEEGGGPPPSPEATDPDTETVLAAFGATYQRKLGVPLPEVEDADRSELAGKLKGLDPAARALLPAAISEYFKRHGRTQGDVWWKKRGWDLHTFVTQGFDLLGEVAGRAAAKRQLDDAVANTDQGLERQRVPDDKRMTPEQVHEAFAETRESVRQAVKGAGGGR